MARLRRRGPDGAEVWQDGAVALGHASLVTTPEAALEQLPLRHGDTGCVITADARLDNREVLLTALGLDRAGGVIGDGALILQAYLRWGEDCVDHLLGDFAFAIRDPRRNAVFCARDHMGMRQLIYTYQPGRLFAFATDARALVTLETVPKRLNEARVLDFLDFQLEPVDDEVTFFEEVLRLPPAHCLMVDADDLRLRRTWRLEPEQPLRLSSDAEYAEAFTEVFTQAVRARLRSPETPGAMLSGGMDSGSVAAVAAGLLAEDGRGPLPTFSGTGPDVSRLETRLVAAAMGLPDIAPTAVRHDDLGALLPALRAWIDDLDDPFDGHMTMIAAVYITAARAGVKVMLDGVGGDTAFSQGNVLRHALAERRIRDIPRIARDTSLETGRRRDFWLTFAQAGWGLLVPPAIRRQRTPLTALRDRRREHRHIEQSLAAPELIAKHDLAGRRARLVAHLKAHDLDQVAHRAAGMTSPNMIVGRERYDRTAAAQGIEPRDPFCDIRLLSFILSLPETQLFREGFRKYLLRRAMAGRLPDAIRWNRFRDHHGYDFNKALFAASPDLGHAVLSCHEFTQRMVRSDVAPLLCDRDNAWNLGLWSRIVFLDVWVKMNRH
ncbi:asparagine synthase-related protein [Antarctobacter heliothermus]|nr:asparagine synthase-related protein [Antarctobacter heliothermus]